MNRKSTRKKVGRRDIAKEILDSPLTLVRIDRYHKVGCPDIAKEILDSPLTSVRIDRYHKTYRCRLKE